MGYSPWGHKELDTTEQLIQRNQSERADIVMHKFFRDACKVFYMPRCIKVLIGMRYIKIFGIWWSGPCYLKSWDWKPSISAEMQTLALP